MSEQQIQKVRVKRLAHIGLWASDVTTQTRFYRQVLGFNLRTTEITSSEQDVELEEVNTYLALGDGKSRTPALFVLFSTIRDTR